MKRPPDDHFSPIAQAYARGRLAYPAGLFAHLVSLCAGHDLAWDCATGSGQAAVALAETFARVEATDLSAEMLQQAPGHPRIHYRVAHAENSGLADGTVDLVTVAQALHWFEHPAFEHEVQRVLKPRGVLACWGYVWPKVNPEVDALLEQFKSRIASHWPPRAALLHAGYSTLRFALPELPAPPFQIAARWTADDYLAHLASWSAVRYHREKTGCDIIGEFRPGFEHVWGGKAVDVHWTMPLRVFRRDP
ncbi:MAG: class I SAM-dependent methyltransferase [Verrucomicrobia bacterium]|nr:class I SAM-dependent methyltransferase [Verrucomicrobiota bacterium]